MQESINEIMRHIRYLSETIGGRGSCTEAERRAAEYTCEQMRSMGIKQVRLEPFWGAPSTYRPFVLAFGVALGGLLRALRSRERWGLWRGAALNALGAWGMLAETDLRPNWMRSLLPKARSQNALGVIPPQGRPERQVVLCAHVDTHRTPIFYSSPTWHKLFGLVVSAAFLSMALAAIVLGVGGLFPQPRVRWLGLVLGGFQAFVLGLCFHADFTPFSPGANDNASGVGVVLEIGRRLVSQPLQRTQVWLVFSGCEEVGAHGLAAFLDAHAEALGPQAVYLVLDEVGLGELHFNLTDGLVIKHPTHPQAVELGRKAAARMGLTLQEKRGVAYTDALVATQRGLVALTLGCLPPSQMQVVSHWHQMSDRVEYIEPQALEKSLEYTWHLLQEIDQP